MNKADQEYFRLVDSVLEGGRVKKNRTGIDTIGIFGGQARFNLAEGFPLLTTKKVWMKGIVHELLWFLSGSTNIKYLVDNDVHIWDEWAYGKFKKDYFDFLNSFDSTNQTTVWHNPNTVRLLENQAEYIRQMKESSEFAKKWGNLGEGTYGGMWRGFPYATEKFVVSATGGGEYQAKWGAVDQIQKVIDKLKNNPDDRRMIVSAWHPYWVDHCALPPCHCLFQFHTEELTLEERATAYYGRPVILMRGLTFGANDGILDHERSISYFGPEDRAKIMEFFDGLNVPKRRLNCQLYQRSVDVGLGWSFNVASYSLLTHMMAQVSNMIPGDFVWSGGDIHIYTSHLEALKEQRAREPYPKLPTLELNKSVKNLFDFKYEDIKIIGYEHHPAIKMDVAV